MELELTEQEVEAVVGVIMSYERICSNATPEPDELTPQKQELFKQLYSFLNKIEKQTK